MPSIPEIKGEFPDISVVASDDKSLRPATGALYAPFSSIHWASVKASFGIALHMHQPTIPAETDDVQNARLISNLQHMMEHQHIGDNHNAPVFLNCYSRISDIIRELVGCGQNPRVMLDYSGNLLWGIKQMGESRVLDNLALVTCDKKYYSHVEWLGTTWSHAVASSTPIPDIKLHVLAWRKHFASIFGKEALKRVKGFSAPEMHLPIHPDVCYEYIKSLKDCGYQWLMVQEHTIENLDGSGIRRQHFPHRLIARNSKGESQEIAVLIKTQGSDTKLVAQMQPFYEAMTLSPQEYAGVVIPPYVAQIGDGENGGVMMNEFPPGYRQAFSQISREGTVAMNGSEYLEFIQGLGAQEANFIPVQPIGQRRIWDTVGKNFGVGACDRAIEEIKKQDPRFNLDKGSWTSDRDWVRGYESVLDPINKLSVKFHQAFDSSKVSAKNSRYANALLYLLLSQTSCFRYWGEGLWTEYAREICRRGLDTLEAS